MRLGGRRLSQRSRFEQFVHPQTLSADLDRTDPPAVPRQHALANGVATVIIVVRVSVVIEPKSHKRAPVKSVVVAKSAVVVKRVEAATAKIAMHHPGTVKAATAHAAVKAATAHSAVKAATAHATVKAATAHSAVITASAHAAVTAHTASASAATTTVAAASECRRRLNQTDRGHCKQSHRHFPQHASLHRVKSPTKHETLALAVYSATKKPAR
jgi:hypothetical protein